MTPKQLFKGLQVMQATGSNLTMANREDCEFAKRVVEKLYSRCEKDSGPGIGTTNELYKLRVGNLRMPDNSHPDVIDSWVDRACRETSMMMNVSGLKVSKWSGQDSETSSQPVTARDQPVDGNSEKSKWPAEANFELVAALEGDVVELEKLLNSGTLDRSLTVISGLESFNPNFPGGRAEVFQLLNARAKAIG